LPFDCVSRTHVGLRRKVNEDALVVRTDRGLWAVADGMGGHDAGDVASRLVTEALSQLPVTYKLEEMVSAATRALERVNRELIVMAGSRVVPLLASLIEEANFAASGLVTAGPIACATGGSSG
jgi:serine/threonine-protein phosphatase Stp1